MKIILLSVLLLVPFLKNSCGVEGKHCELPIKYHVDCNIDIEKENIIDENVLYWNDVLNFNIFEKTNCDDFGIEFSIEKNDMLKQALGLAYVYFSGNNFDSQLSYVSLYEDIFLNGSLAKIVIRHESGHVIGLAHNEIADCLMSRTSADACEQEILKIKEVYELNNRN